MPWKNRATSKSPISSKISNAIMIAMPRKRLSAPPNWGSKSVSYKSNNVMSCQYTKIYSSYTYHWWLFNHVNVQGLVIDINSSVILLNFIFNQGLFFCVPYQILSGITQRESKLFLETKNQTYYILRKKYWKKKKNAVPNTDLKAT